MKTYEPQYQKIIKHDVERGREDLGLMTNQAWSEDPKRLTFTFARYKFVAKMLEGRNEVLEIGCADAFATRIVVQAVKRLLAVDADEIFVNDVRARHSDRWPFECRQHNILAGPVAGKFDGVFALDVLEHIPRDEEVAFMENAVASTADKGVLILGMPSLESQTYASEISKAGHVNCKSQPEFKELMQRYFDNVFMFCMNDETLHTGYHKMAHYLFALGVQKRS